MSRVAVIIPVRNGVATIRRTIDSALGQECERPEVIVVDDGSTDATPRILGSYGDQIRVLRQRNCGPSAARNAGAAAASPDSEYFTFLDADDVQSVRVQRRKGRALHSCRQALSRTAPRPGRQSSRHHCAARPGVKGANNLAPQVSASEVIEDGLARPDGEGHHSPRVDPR
jgi:glycosyltransferase involved in cell wall biosynthesis